MGKRVRKSNAFGGDGSKDSSHSREHCARLFALLCVTAVDRHAAVYESEEIRENADLRTSNTKGD